MNPGIPLYKENPTDRLKKPHLNRKLANQKGVYNIFISKWKGFSGFGGVFRRLGGLGGGGGGGGGGVAGCGR